MIRSVSVILAAAGLLIGFSPNSYAADIPVRPYVKAAPVVAAPVSNWSGFYIGGSIGARWSDSDWTTTCLQPGLGGVACPNNLPAFIANDNPVGFDDTSLRGGIYFGFNWQISPMWVVGLEGDFAWARNKHTHSGIPGAWSPANAGAPGLDTSTVASDWDAGLRARIGYLINPNLLLFATGGVSWANLEATAFCGSAFPTGWCTGGGVFLGTAQTVSDTRVGWTLGVGLEWMLTPNWLIRGEYRYADYGSMDGLYFAGNNGFVVNGDSLSNSVDLRTHTALFGVAYKFGR